VKGYDYNEINSLKNYVNRRRLLLAAVRCIACDNIFGDEPYGCPFE
jgi:hypothetical protein